jgi:hypothetical protein
MRGFKLKFGFRLFKGGWGFGGETPENLESEGDDDEI